MSALDAWRHRLRTAVLRDSASSELQEEMRLHLERQEEDLMASGMARDAARRATRVRFGNAARWRESVRASWEIPWLDATGRALRGSSVQWRRNPWTTLAIGTVLAIGIAAVVATLLLSSAVSSAPMTATALDGQRSRGVAQVLVVAGVVLLAAAIANAANLVLARTRERHGELALRGALGARPARLVGMVLAECSVTSLVAALPALGLASVLVRMAQASMPAHLLQYVPDLLTTHVDARALAATLVLAAVAGLLVAAPATRFILEGSITASSTRAQRQRAQPLLAAQVALGALLLSVTSLFHRSALALASVSPTRNPDLAGHFLVPRALGVFAVAALVLALIGACASVASTIAQQVRAATIRRALGASMAGTVWRLTAPTVRPVLLGAVAGLLLFAVTGHLLTPYSYGVRILDVPTVSAIALVAIVALAAGAVMATVRARRIEVTRLMRDG